MSFELWEIVCAGGLGFIGGMLTGAWATDFGKRHENDLLIGKDDEDEVPW